MYTNYTLHINTRHMLNCQKNIHSTLFEKSRSRQLHVINYYFKYISQMYRFIHVKNSRAQTPMEDFYP